MEGALETLARAPSGMNFRQGLVAFDTMLNQTNEAIRNVGLTAEEVQRNQLAQVLGPQGAERIARLDAAMDRLTRARDQQQVTTDINAMVRSLTEQRDTFGMAGRQADLYRLRIRNVGNANQAQISQIEALIAELDELEASAKAATDQANDLRDALQGVQAVSISSAEALARVNASVNTVAGGQRRPGVTSAGGFLNGQPTDREPVRLLTVIAGHLQALVGRPTVVFQRGDLQ